MSGNSSHLKINYFPTIEVIIFTLTVLTSITIYVLSGLSWWFLIIVIVFSYLITMGGATIIKLNDDTLKITSFNPFLASPLISTQSIIKINSVQILEHQSDIDFGGSFFLLTRRYEVEYVDTNGKKRKAYFSILNKNKEESILRTLRTLPHTD